MAVNIKLKHSSIQDKAPVAADLSSAGEVALNLHPDSPALYIKDSNGDIVKLAGAGSVTDDDAVKKSELASQNMVGDLTLGTDKITLDASGGSANFANTIATGDITYASSYAFLSPGGIGLLDNSTTSKFKVEAATGKAEFGTIATDFTNGIVVDGNTGLGQSYIAIYGSGGGENAIQIYANDGVSPEDTVLIKHNGEITAAGNVVIGDDPWATTAAGVAIDKTGTVSVGNGGGNVWYGKDTSGGTSTVTSSISNTGAATFKGPIQSIPDAASYCYAVGMADTASGGLYMGASGGPDSSLFLGPGNGLGVTVSIYGSTGAATFDGQITTGDGSGSPSTSGVGIGNQGFVSISQKNRTSQNCLSIYDTTNAVSTFNVTGAGAGSFRGSIISGSLDPGGGGGNYFAGGEIAAYAPLTTNPVFRGWDASGSANNLVISMYANGNATFAGTITATVVPPSDARFKENIEPAKPQLADVVALGGILKNYDWNDQAPLNEEIRSQRQLGLIAQEAEKVCPAIVKDIHATKQGAVITPEKVIPAVVEPAHTIPAVTKEVPNPRPTKKGETITVEVTPAQEVPEKVITPEKVIPATYETLDDSYKGISTDALIMKLIGAVAELSAEVTALKAAKLTKK